MSHTWLLSESFAFIEREQEVVGRKDHIKLSILFQQTHQSVNEGNEAREKVALLRQVSGNVCFSSTLTVSSCLFLVTQAFSALKSLKHADI